MFESTMFALSLMLGLLLIGLFPDLCFRYFESCKDFKAHQATIRPSDEGGCESWVRWNLVLVRARRLASFWTMLFGIGGLVCLFSSLHLAAEADVLPVGLVFAWTFGVALFLPKISPCVDDDVVY